jgi:UDP-glucose 4-epimerase
VKILIAGGAGYIGSTIGSYLEDAGHVPVILDSLVTGREEFAGGRAFYRGDIRDGAVVDQVFADHPDIYATVQCAALIVVPESVEDPVGYYDANVAAGIEFVQHLLRNGCSRLLFSSSASIYAPAEDFTVDEDSPIEPASPYAATKAVFEQVLADAAAGTDMRVLSLRYFNPIGADPKLRTGLQIAEPSHALGKMLQARRDGTAFQVTGTDWPTRDGTGIRDYVHVWDLARAHVAALERFDEVVPEGYLVINLGTGTGTTVLELHDALRAVVGEDLPREDAPPRPGDGAGVYPRSGRAKELLGWEPELSIEDGIRDTLRWFEVRGERLGL